MLRVPELRIKNPSYLASGLSCGTSRRVGEFYLILPIYNLLNMVQVVMGAGILVKF